jgi:hypothetical protein
MLMIHYNQLHQRIYHSIQKKKFSRRVNRNSLFQKDKYKIMNQMFQCNFNRINQTYDQNYLMFN